MTDDLNTIDEVLTLPDAGAGVSRGVQAIGAAVDVVMMLGVLAAGWWAWSGAGGGPVEQPVWVIGSGPAGGGSLSLRIAPREPWKLGERALNNEAELAAAARQSKDAAKITVNGQVLFAQLARALDVLGNERISDATVEIAE